MKKKIKDLWKTLLLCTALTVTSCITPVMAAPTENTENIASEPEAPAKPESYDWEIQSNKIPGWPQGPKVVAETAILMDIDSGSILYAKGIDEKRAPASTTKIMTAMLALEQVPFDTQITFTDEVNNIEADSTHIGIKPGETLTMKDCAYAILLVSANEVSSGVAEYIGGDVQTFVDSMNQRAKDLGCQNTHFVNANGLYSEDHYTTARDLAIISCAAFQNETFREIIKTPYYIVPETNITNETRWLNNHHKMVLPDSSEYYEGCLGGKTGYTVKAGNTLVTYAERNGMRLVCVVLADINEHYNDTRALFDYGFNNFQKVSADAASLTAAKKDTLGKKLMEQGALNQTFQESSLIVPKESKEPLTFQAVLEDDHNLSITYCYGDTVLGTSSLPATDEVLATAKELGIRKENRKQGSVAFQQEKENKETTDSSPSKSPKAQSPKGLLEELAHNFRQLPNWKYPALIFIGAALIFYIVTLILRIQRSRKRRKRRKNRKKGASS